MKNIIVVANIKIKNEFKDEVYNELVKLYKATHQYDEGCIQYDLHKDLSDENSFTFIETWKNEESLTAHKQKEHFQTFVSHAQNKIESMSVQKLEKSDI